MTCPSTGPCSLAITPEDLCCFDEITESNIPCISGSPVDSATIDRAIEAAQFVVWALSGRQFGTCPVTIRPCFRRDWCDDPWTYNPFIPHSGAGWLPALRDGQWFNICGCVDSCSCKDICEINLPYPTCSINEVKFNGIPQDLDTFIVYDFRKLVRANDDCFPHCNDLSKPDTEEGTWSITLEYGKPWPSMGGMAIAELACEIVKSCMGKPCKLPSAVTSISRQGLTLNKLNPLTFLKTGQTGLYQVDLFLQAVNPNGLSRRPAIWSPDVPSWRVQTF